MRQNFDSGVEGGVGFKILRELQDRRAIGTMVVVGIWYNNHNAPLKGAGFYKNFYDVIGDVLTWNSFLSILSWVSSTTAST